MIADQRVFFCVPILHNRDACGVDSLGMMQKSGILRRYEGPCH
jgi:hypothetical protein